ncbi:bifunctional ribokinase/ribose-5-phosphate isomerase A [Muribaculaceae bacterium]|nr:bifunctional ribokinase/ribose-5-phosphate isomerase A [Muribaculaceae bacterium]
MEHFIRPGETFGATRLDKFPGGKGLNQSIALARAGARVYHAGNVGPDGEVLVETLRNAGVDTNLIRRVEEVTGHAVIQVDSRGDNSIILYAGANARVTSDQIDRVLEEFARGDYLILQNEINLVGEIMDKAFDKGMTIVLNPSPMNEEIRKLPLEKVSIFLLNEIEGEELTGKRDPDTYWGIFPSFHTACHDPGPERGNGQSTHANRDASPACPAFPAKAVPVPDTPLLHNTSLPQGPRAVSGPYPRIPPGPPHEPAEAYPTPPEQGTGSHT